MAQANELRHVAVILDGNGRWAAQHGVERKEGHLAGANRVVDFMNYISRYESIRYVTLYAFSRTSRLSSRNCARMFISASTSSFDRFQFSVLNAYSVT